MAVLSDCPVETALSIVRDKWVVLILRELEGGPARFGELRRSLDGISQKVLTERLRALERDGIVVRRDLGGRRIEYGLTPIGRGLEEAISHLAAWGESYRELMRDGGPEAPG